MTANTPMKKVLFGGYHKKSVNALLSSKEQQLEYHHMEIERLKNDNVSAKVNAAKLDADYRMLLEEVNRKNKEIQQLESRLSSLQNQLEESIRIRRNYDQYLNTVGQIYMVAYDSAKKIVDRADSSSKKLLENISDKTGQTNLKTKQTIDSIKAKRDQLALELPSILKSVSHTFQEMDSFLSALQSVPQYYENTEAVRQDTLQQIQQEITAFQQQKQKFVTGENKTEAENFFKNNTEIISAHIEIPIKLDQNKGEILGNSANVKRENSLDNNITGSAPSVNEEKSIYKSYVEPVEIHEENLTLLEQEKQKRKLESLGVDVPTPPVAKQPAAPDPINVTDYSTEDSPQFNEDNHMIMPKKYPNVKDLLNKYSQLK